MFPAFLDTAQGDLVEAHGKAPPLVTAQQALLEAQASAVKHPFLSATAPVRFLLEPQRDQGRINT